MPWRSAINCLPDHPFTALSSAPLCALRRGHTWPERGCERASAMPGASLALHSPIFVPFNCNTTGVDQVTAGGAIFVGSMSHRVGEQHKVPEDRGPLSRGPLDRLCRAHREDGSDASVPEDLLPTDFACSSWRGCQYVACGRGCSGSSRWPRGICRIVYLEVVGKRPGVDRSDSCRVTSPQTSVM